MIPRHVKAFPKDDKIVFEINEKPEPKQEDCYTSSEWYDKRMLWRSQHKYIEGAEEQQQLMKEQMIVKEHSHLNGVDYFDINPSSIEVREVPVGEIICQTNHLYFLDKCETQCQDCKSKQKTSQFIYLKESEGQDELWNFILGALDTSCNLKLLKELKSQFTITRNTTIHRQQNGH